MNKNANVCSRSYVFREFFCLLTYIQFFKIIIHMTIRS